MTENFYRAPRLLKIVINMGVGRALSDKTYLPSALKDLTLITGQKPLVRKAKKAIAGFKIQKGDAVGLKVTLRGKRMRDFLEKFLRVVLPRTKDFRGLSMNQDGSGNLTVGIVEQTVFPEIDANKVDQIRGLEVTLVQSTASKTEGEKLWRALGVPFAKK